MKKIISNDLSYSLTENISKILDKLGHSQDVQIREIKSEDHEMDACCVFIDGISNSDTIEEHVIKPLKKHLHAATQKESIHALSEQITTKTIKTTSDMAEIVDELITGNTITLINGFKSSVVSSTTQWPERSLDTPSAQRTPTGPNIGFNESLSQNLALIRKILRNPSLRIENNVCDPRVKTNVSLLYIEGIIQNEILDEIKEKLAEIDTEVLLDSSYIEEMIIGDIFTPFPLTLASDRPDVVCSELLGGKAAIIVEGSPSVVTLPTVLSQFFQSPEDYHTLTKGIFLKRFYRIFFYFLSMILPGLYIAFTVHHPGLVPTNLLVSIVAQREIVPFPTVLEVIVFHLLILVITESSLRLPQSVILTVSVFGGIILGQSAVEAQIVQPMTLFVMSASYILGSVVPVYSLRPVIGKLALRFILIAGLLGLYGIMLGLLLMILHLCSLRSFRVPYFSPIAPFNLRDQKDNLVREELDNIMDNSKRFTIEDASKKDKR